MATSLHRVSEYLQRILGERSLRELEWQLEPKHDDPAPKVPLSIHFTQDSIERQWALLQSGKRSREALLDSQTLAYMEPYERNIENFIGTLKIPVGLAGPLRINGLFAQGDYYIPLATTEAALVASYNRGAQMISEAGGCTAMLLNEGISRVPGFAFRNLREAGRFVVWTLNQRNAIKRVAEATTTYGKLADIHVTVEGNHVYLDFEFTTGDAAGQNMVTIATEAICAYIRARSPIPPLLSFGEANLSGDKKASARAFLSVRGRKVTAEITVPGDLVRRRLHTSPAQMVECWRMSAIGGILSGTIGIQGQYANGLAALFIACGQDAGCVAESAMGVTRLEQTSDGLYAAVTLPNLVVGTVGGGTGLPSQQACLNILGLAGPGKAPAFSEVCTALLLAGELSIIGALCAGEFARAHQRLARDRVNAKHNSHATRNEVDHEAPDRTLVEVSG